MKESKLAFYERRAVECSDADQPEPALVAATLAVAAAIDKLAEVTLARLRLSERVMREDLHLPALLSCASCGQQFESGSGHACPPAPEVEE